MPSANARPVLSTPELANFSGFPADWAATSACAHIIFFVILLLIPGIPVIRDTPLRDRQIQETRLQLSKSTDTALLASVQSSSSSSSAAPSPKSAGPATRSSAAGSNSVLPVVFKGAQHIVSDTPDADNAIQTILQPDIENPPRIHTPIPVPSMVKLASAQRPPSIAAPHLSASIKVAAPPVPAPTPAPPLPTPQHVEVNTVPLTTQTALVDSPKLPVFVTAGRNYSPPKQPPPPPSTPNPVAAAPQPSKDPLANPGPPDLIARPNTGQDAHNILVANAIEVHAAPSSSALPEVEIHGRFEVSSNPRLSAGGASAPPDSKAGSGTASGSGHGTGASKSRGNGSGSGTGSASGASGAASGAPGGHGGGNGNGSGAATGSGSGHGSSGNGSSGNGAGAGNGNGTGAGNGNGVSPFGGITIAGGVHGGSGGSVSPAVHDVTPPKHSSYGMTIISTGSSGGGLRDFGVFNDGPVYTVYLDVSKIGINGTRWSLQYSAARDIRIAHPGVLLSPPFPDTEKLPHLPPELVASNMGRLLVVQATLTPDGALESFRILQTPDERLNSPLLASLSQWTFQAATMGTDKVPIKVLIGIPIAAPMATEPDTVQQAGGQTLREGAPRSSAQ